MTRNSFKRKAIIFGVMVFMSIALISTGFAAWIISTNKGGEKTGNIQVGVISEKNIQVLDIKLSADSFEFEPAKDDNNGRLRWDSSKYEVLSTTVTAYVTNTQYLKELNIKLDLSQAVGVQNAATAKYINLPACVTAVNVNDAHLVELGTGEDFQYNNSKKYSELTETEKAACGTIKKLTYEIKFTWGEKFGNTNPSLYYDDAGKEISDEIMRADMIAFRKAMYNTTDEEANNVLTPLSFKVILEAIAS